MSDDWEDEERELRVLQMQTNIEKMRADMKWENRKFGVSLVIASAALVAAGAALGNYIATRPVPTPPPQTIIIQQAPPP